MAWLSRVIYRRLVSKERKHAKSGRTPATTEAPDARLETGGRGETLAYWHLRQAGYIMVARNWRLGPHSGELDLVGWDGPVLAFVEVKTRSTGAAGAPEESLTREQRQRILHTAREYMRRLSPKPVSHRFDVASVGWDTQEGYQVRLIKDAFRD